MGPVHSTATPKTNHGTQRVRGAQVDPCQREMGTPRAAGSRQGQKVKADEHRQG